VPVNRTEFAKDSVFGFSHAFLPDYVEEKTDGRIPAAEVERFGLEDVRSDLSERLRRLGGNVCCAVDAETQSDLDGFAGQVLAAVGEGKRFLFRSAASLLTAFAGLPPQPVAPGRMSEFVRGGRPGVVLVGSHVEKSTRQLQHLLANTNAAPLEVDLDRLADDEAGLEDDLIACAETAIAGGRNVVLYTSRGERKFETKSERFAFGKRISDLLVRLVQRLPRDIGYLISKGGITSNDTLSHGLGLRTARVLGQVRAGCSVVRCPDDHPRFPGLPVVIFPGNVGGDEALAEIYRILTAGATTQADGGRVAA